MLEKNRSTYIKLGFFIIVGLIFFIVAIFYVGSKSNLFTPTFKIKSTFSSVSGLLEGNSVRFAGINVGTVQNIEIVATDKVVVTMVIESDVKKFIKKDSEVSIGSEGLVGNKIVTISPGTAGAKSVENDDELKSVQPVELSDIFNSLNESTKNAQRISSDLADIIAKVNGGEGTLGQLVNNDKLYRTVDSTITGFAQSTQQVNNVLRKVASSVDTISGDITRLTGKIRSITSDIADITQKMNSSQSIVGTLLTDTAFARNLKDVIINANATTKNLENGSFSFAQNMEALKHNFLFKGYFEDIGYWDKTGWEKDYFNKQLEIKLREQQLDKREEELDKLQEELDSLKQKLEIK
jgi:phospholipid/cholesterol/gamma-HCH transport system substrate-binding protein